MNTVTIPLNAYHSEREAHGSYDSTTTDNDGYWIDAHKRFNDRFTDATGILRRFAVAFHGWGSVQAVDAIHYARHLDGSDWLDVLTVVTEEGYDTAAGWFDEWSQWARDGVYTVGAERVEECACDCHATHASREKINGNELIYMGSIYADDVEEAALYYASEGLYTRS